MKFIDWLRKLGILRFGVVKAKYKTAKERPYPLQSDSVFNEKKDLITKKDLKKFFKKK